MKQIVSEYLAGVSNKFFRETSSEYSYRTEFEMFLRQVFESMNISAIDHDAKSKDGNKPDFAIIKNLIPILYIETKDIGVSLDKIEKSEQMSRYFGYTNLILTDYVEFRFYRNGIPYGEPIKIADYDIKNRKVTPREDSFDRLVRRMLDFTQSHKEPIRSGEHLAKIMGGKAQRIRDNIRDFLKVENEKSEILKVYKTIKQLLVHDLTLESFADMYAQTVVYGLFVARYYDSTPDDFSRREARDLIPNSNPFLRHFFDHIVGPDFDKRLEFIVDELCEAFSYSDVEKLMSDFYKKSSKSKTTHDPVIHFYEDFLSEYDQELRKKMGAYYTPTPIVRFMTRSVDEILKNEFGLKAGLADTSKLADGKTHRVQILDPAVGTGTFISGVIGEIYKTFKGQEGRWPKYVYDDLLPRIHGFELMMAPYTIAHLKLAMAFKKTGFHYFVRRLGIYLTNSLEKSDPQENLFDSFGLADSIAQESKSANEIKNNKPIMVVIGNPPYSGESSNAFYTEHDVYKQEPSGGKLQERNSKWINDDYVKFFRLAESMIEKASEGIVCMITAHGYIDNPTFRGMRWHLMKTFDSIYVLDLHGNTNKDEVHPDGSQDENVFNIKTGVSIFIGVKKNNREKDLADVYKFNLFGKRETKYGYLLKKSVQDILWDKVAIVQPNFSWVIRDEKVRKEYDKGFSLCDLFKISSVGIVTARDKMSIQFGKKDIESVVDDFLTLKESELRIKYNLGKDVRDWKVGLAKADVKDNFSPEKIIPISYRPFDRRWTFYTGNSRGFHCMPRGNVMQHLADDSICLVVLRQVKAGKSFQHIFISKGITESTYVSNKTSEIGYIIPLSLKKSGETISNLDRELLSIFHKVVGPIEPISVLDYIYAFLFSPQYREKYADFLKIDFPRIPYPKDKQQFTQLSELGSKLRKLHLMEDACLDNFITTFPEVGSHILEHVPKYKDGKVFINDTQYFGKVPELAWNFYIGGYQPAQKWLKDRKGRLLSNEDIEHYQKIIVGLVETQKIMKQIDEIIEI